MKVPSKEDLRQTTGFTTPVGAYAEARFTMAWNAATDSKDRVAAVFQYAKDLHWEQQDYAAISPHDGKDITVESVETIADRAALERHLSRDEWRDLDKELEAAGYREDSLERDLSASWSAAGNAEERAEALVRYAKEAAAAGTPGTVREIASLNALGMGLPRNEWTVLDAKLCEYGEISEEVTELNKKLEHYEKVKHFALNGQVEYERWKAQQEAIAAKQREWNERMEAQYRQERQRAEMEAQEAKHKLQKTTLLFRIFHPFQSRKIMREAAEMLEQSKETLDRTKQEATASMQEEMDRELNKMQRNATLQVPEFLEAQAIEGEMTVQLVELTVGDWITPEAVSAAVTQSKEWCSHVEQDVAELPQELRPYLDRRLVREYENYNAPEQEAVEQGMEQGMEREPELELELEP